MTSRFFTLTFESGGRLRLDRKVALALFPFPLFCPPPQRRLSRNRSVYFPIRCFCLLFCRWKLVVDMATPAP